MTGPGGRPSASTGLGGLGPRQRQPEGAWGDGGQAKEGHLLTSVPSVRPPGRPGLTSGTEGSAQTGTRDTPGVCVASPLPHEVSGPSVHLLSRRDLCGGPLQEDGIGIRCCGPEALKSQRPNCRHLCPPPPVPHQARAPKARFSLRFLDATHGAHPHEAARPRRLSVRGSSRHPLWARERVTPVCGAAHTHCGCANPQRGLARVR